MCKIICNKNANKMMMNNVQDHDPLQFFMKINDLGRVYKISSVDHHHLGTDSASEKFSTP